MTGSIAFYGLSAFPLTPVVDAAVDIDALSLIVERLAVAGVGSVGLLGSTGIYAYLDRHQRHRAVAAAVEAAAGRVPVMVGVGALRTDWSQELAREAERSGAQALLLAPMSYTPLTDDEVAGHFQAVAGSTGLPICIYNNPGTTNFAFSESLIVQLAQTPGIAAVKMPPPDVGTVQAEIGRLREAVPGGFAIGYSGDWVAAPALLAGADAWYSVVAGLLPVPSLRLAVAAQAGDRTTVASLTDAFEPLWALFRAHGSVRVMYVVADLIGLRVGRPPLPIKPLVGSVKAEIVSALEHLGQAR